MQIDSGDLSEGYPFRPGSDNRVLSICLWMKLASLPGPGSYFYAYVKWLSVWVLVYNDGAGVHIALVSWYNGGGNYQIVLHESSLSAGRWYHVGVTLRRDSATIGSACGTTGRGRSWGRDKIGAFANVPMGCDNVAIGYAYNGLLDELPGHQSGPVDRGDRRHPRPDIGASGKATVL
jgi:hypothetical protein